MHAINGGGNAWIKIIGVSDQYASKRNQNHDGKRWDFNLNFLIKYIEILNFVYLKYPAKDWQDMWNEMNQTCSKNSWSKNSPLFSNVHCRLLSGFIAGRGSDIALQ